MTSTLNKKGSNRVVEIAVYFRANGGSSRGVAVGGARFPIAGSLLGAYHDSGHYAVFVRWGRSTFPASGSLEPPWERQPVQLWRVTSARACLLLPYVSASWDRS